MHDVELHFAVVIQHRAVAKSAHRCSETVGIVCRDPNVLSGIMNDGAESMSTVVIAFDCSAVHETRLEPGSRLCECLADGDGLVVQLAAVLDGCFGASRAQQRRIAVGSKGC